jgi:hypothetical protein
VHTLLDVFFHVFILLGGVKFMINIVAAHNKEVIVIERRCNITLEDF